MKLTSLTLTALCALTTLAQAHIGWTPKQCEEHYGPGTTTFSRTNVEGHRYHIGPFKVDIGFQNGQATLITYTKEGAQTGKPITEAEIQDILASNGPNLEWRPEDLWGGPHIEYWFGQDCNSSGQVLSSRYLLLETAVHWTVYKDGKPYLQAKYSVRCPLEGYFMWAPTFTIQTFAQSPELVKSLAKNLREQGAASIKAQDQDAQHWTQLLKLSDEELVFQYQKEQTIQAQKERARPLIDVVSPDNLKH